MTVVNIALSALIVLIAVKGLIDLRRGRVHWAMGYHIEQKANPRAFWLITLVQWSGLILLVYALFFVAGLGT